MKLPQVITSAGNKIVRTASKNSPTILAGVAIAGVVATAVMMVKSTLKAKEVLEDHEDQIAMLEEKFENDPSIEEDTQKEMRKQVTINTAKKLAPIYAPAIITMGMTIACVVGCNSVHIRRQAALAAAYNISESTLRNYETKAKELIGAKKADQVKDESNIERIKSIVSGSPAVIETGKWSELFIDNQTGQLFRSNMEYVRHCVTDIDNRLTDMGGDTFVPLNDLLMAWGCYACDLGKDFGFNVESRMQNHLTIFDQLRFTHWTDPDTNLTYHFIDYPVELGYSVQVK
jgi:hypothetical protein